MSETREFDPATDHSVYGAASRIGRPTVGDVVEMFGQDGSRTFGTGVVVAAINEPVYVVVDSEGKQTTWVQALAQHATIEQAREVAALMAGSLLRRGADAAKGGAA